MEPESFEKLVNYGALGTILALVLFGVWRIVSYVGHRLFDDPSGLVTRYVGKQEEYLQSLAERDAKQQELCGSHVSLLSDVRQPIVLTASDVNILKQAALRHCEMCRSIVSAEFPAIAARIDPHLREMERILS